MSAAEYVEHDEAWRSIADRGIDLTASHVDAAIFSHLPEQLALHDIGPTGTIRCPDCRDDRGRGDCAALLRVKTMALLWLLDRLGDAR